MHALGILLLVIAAPTAAGQPAQQEPMELRALPEVRRSIDEAGVHLHDGQLTVHLRNGWMVPIVRAASSERPAEMVGFSWVGEGEASVRLTDRADGRALANRLVQRVGADRAEIAHVSQGGPLVVNLDRGVFLSVDPALERHFLGPDAHVAPNPLEVVIYGSREGEAAGQQAARTFARRHALYQELDLRIEQQIARDLAMKDAGLTQDTAPVMLVDLRTDTRFGLGSGATGSDRWLGMVRDDTGQTNFRLRSQLLTLGRSDGGVAKAERLGGEPFPPVDPRDVTSPPAPPVRLEPDHAESTILIEPPRALALPVQVEARLTLRSIGGATQWTTLDLPRVEAEPGSWQLLELSTENGDSVLAGPLEYIGAWDGSVNVGQRYPPRMSARATVFLPEPVLEGETVTLVVRTRDVWPYGGWIRCGSPEEAGHPSGATTGLQPYLPSVGSGWLGAPWRATTHVGVRDDSGLVAVVPGDPASTRIDSGWIWTTATQTTSSPWLRVAVGAWPRTRFDRANPTSTHVRLHKSPDRMIEGLPAQTRQLGSYLAGWLPPLSHREWHVIESPTQCLTWRYTRISVRLKNGDLVQDNSYEIREAPKRCTHRLELAPKAVIPLQRYVIAGNRKYVMDSVPHQAAGAFAHQLAHQYWGHLARPAHPSDFWIAETFAELYSCMYVGAAHGPRACEARMKQARERWERVGAGTASLTAAYSSPDWEDIVWLYGPYVMLEMLRPRLGNDTFFLALDVLLRDHPDEPLTTERLQHYFEQASGQDLGDFFDLWVHQGFIPSLALTWDLDEHGRVEGVITSDLPFGTIDVPVLVRGKDVQHVVMVDVVDGEGRFRSEPVEGRPRVSLDPDGRVLARKRQVRRGRGASR